MAQHTSITLVDDLDDTLPAQETVYFGVDGVAWEINLSSPHAAILREDLAFWVAHARRTAGHTHRCPAANSSDTVAAAPDRGTRRTELNILPCGLVPDGVGGRATARPH